MPHGLPRKIRIAFILQAVLASLGILLGAWLVSLVIKHSLVGAALREEAAYYWTLHEASPVQPPPNTQNIRGYLLESGQSALSLPANLRNLEPGFHELPKDDQLVLVDVRPAGRLYLVFLRSRAEMLAFWFGIVPVLLTLLAVYGASWVTYRASKRLVSPVNWLARRVSRWDPGIRKRPTWSPTSCRRTCRARPGSWRPRCTRWPTGSARTWHASATSPAMPAMNCVRR